MAIPNTPLTRIEQYLDAIANNGSPSPSGGGVLVVHMDSDTGALDKTWQEIHDANFAVLVFNAETSILCATCVEIASSGYGVDFYMPPHTGGTGELLPFVATSADGYPVYGGD